MTREHLAWSVFVSVLCPMILRNPSDPVLVTVLQIILCFCMVAVADQVERS